MGCQTPRTVAQAAEIKILRKFNSAMHGQQYSVRKDHYSTHRQTSNAWTEKTESVGEWKAKVYEMHNVVFSFRSRKVAGGESDVAGSEQVLPLELDEDEDGFLVAENPNFGFPPPRRPSVNVNIPQTKEKEYVRSLRPSVWLTEQFPLKTEEFLPLLDILASKVKAVRRLRELLTTKFPPGTFPVKVAMPVVPTVRVVITFTKFVELQPLEQFFTPFSSPRHLLGDQHETETQRRSTSSSSSSSTASTWLREITASRDQGISSSNDPRPWRLIPTLLPFLLDIHGPV